MARPGGSSGSRPWSAPILVALLGAWLFATGPGLAKEYADGLALCGADCRDFKDTFADHHQAAQLAVTAIVLAAPGAARALLGCTTRGA